MHLLFRIKHFQTYALKNNKLGFVCVCVYIHCYSVWLLCCSRLLISSFNRECIQSRFVITVCNSLCTSTTRYSAGDYLVALVLCNLPHLCSHPRRGQIERLELLKWINTHYNIQVNISTKHKYKQQQLVKWNGCCTSYY